jgi:hypothetical protein
MRDEEERICEIEQRKEFAFHGVWSRIKERNPCGMVFLYIVFLKLNEG